MDYGINAMTNAAKGSALGMQQGYAAQASANNYPPTDAPVTASESILSRLNSIRMNFADLCQSASRAADKIVGSAPTPLANGTIAVDAKARPPATCFIDALQQDISELESIGRDTQEHLNRIHRSF